MELVRRIAVSWSRRDCIMRTVSNKTLSFLRACLRPVASRQETHRSTCAVCRCINRWDGGWPVTFGTGPFRLSRDHSPADDGVAIAAQIEPVIHSESLNSVPHFPIPYFTTALRSRIFQRCIFSFPYTLFVLDRRAVGLRHRLQNVNDVSPTVILIKCASYFSGTEQSIPAFSVAPSLLYTGHRLSAA